MKSNSMFGHTMNVPHIHYWICSEPDNGFVKAQCRYCGETRLWETLGSKWHKQESHKDWQNWENEEEYNTVPKVRDLEAVG